MRSSRPGRVPRAANISLPPCLRVVLGDAASGFHAVDAQLFTVLELLPAFVRACSRPRHSMPILTEKCDARGVHSDNQAGNIVLAELHRRHRLLGQGPAPAERVRAAAFPVPRRRRRLLRAALAFAPRRTPRPLPRSSGKSPAGNSRRPGSVQILNSCLSVSLADLMPSQTKRMTHRVPAISRLPLNQDALRRCQPGPHRLYTQPY